MDLDKINKLQKFSEDKLNIIKNRLLSFTSSNSPPFQYSKTLGLMFQKCMWDFVVSVPFSNQAIQGFPNRGDWLGGNLDTIAKNCMKITKLEFLGQKHGRHGGKNRWLNN